MSIRRIAASAAAAAVLCVAVIGTATAAPATSASRLRAAVDRLAEIDTQNYSGTFRTTGDIPVQFTHQSATRYSIATGMDEERVVDGVSYRTFDSTLHARAAAAGQPALGWYSLSDSGTSQLQLADLLPALRLAATHGAVHADGAALQARIDYRDVDTWDATSQMLIGGPVPSRSDVRVTVDRSGRIRAATVTHVYVDEDHGVFASTSALVLEYGSAEVHAPPADQTVPIVETASYPVLSALERAAYSTADRALAYGLSGSGEITLDALETAAAEEPTPEGLQATYTPTGLKYTLGDTSLCISVTPDQARATVTACPVR